MVTIKRCLEGKTVLITGGAGGAGRASSKLFAAEGGQVSIIDINEKAGKEIVSEIESEGGHAIFIQADVSKAKQVQDSIKIICSISIILTFYLTMQGR